METLTGMNISINAATLFRTLELASFAHRLQKRNARNKQDRLPYIHHPIQVANKIAQAIEHESALPIIYTFGTQWIEPTMLAAIMHDAIEDTDTTQEDVEAAAGKLAAKITLEVTDPDDMPSDTQLRKARQAEKAKTYSIGATNLKISDQTSNLTDVRLLMPKWKKAKITAYIEGAKLVVFSTPERYRLPFLVDKFNESVEMLYSEIDAIAIKD